MGLNQLNVDPLVTLLKETVSSSKSSAVKCYDLFTTIGIVVSITNAAALGGSVKIEVSNDNSIWGDYSGSSVAVTGNTVIPYNISDFAFKFIRVTITISAGSADFEITSVGKQG